MLDMRTMTLADAMAVVSAMREMDRACVSAIIGDTTDEAFAVDRWRSNGPAWAFVDGDRVVAIGGLTLHSDWLAVAWFLATPDLSGQSWRKVIRSARTVLSNASNPAFAHYRHRIEAHVLGDWKAAQQFAASFGFRFEGTRTAAGRGGEDIQMWAITGPVKGS